MPTQVKSMDLFKKEIKSDYLDGKITLEIAIKELLWVGFTDQQAYDYLKS